MKEPLNIISESYNNNLIGGPNKVLMNTLKGLTLIDYPYVINKDISEYRYNWVHDSVKGLLDIGLFKIPAVIGPNIVILPKELPHFRASLSKCIYLHPSKWCVDLWKEIGFIESKIFSWPAGIDTDRFFQKRTSDDYNNVLIYFKRRNPLLLDRSIEIVKRAGLNPMVIRYGEYNEDQYIRIISTCKFGIWIGVSESQGIGQLEAMSMGLPLIICDVNSLFESNEFSAYKFPVDLQNFKPTSAPYFDNRCGIIINDFGMLEESVNKMVNAFSLFRPREYILENLSLEKQAIELLSFFEVLKEGHQHFFLKHKTFSKIERFKVTIASGLLNNIYLFNRKIITGFKMLKGILEFKYKINN